MNKRRRDILLRRSISTSTILKPPEKLSTQQQPEQQKVSPLTDIKPQRRSSAMGRMEVLQALPPPPLIDESERETVTVEKEDRRKLLAGSKRVSFSSKSKCVYLEPFTKEEKNAAFYSHEEYKRIYVDNINTIQKMVDKSEQVDFRGLLAPKARYEREQRIKFVVSKVLKEQQKSKTIKEDWVKEFSDKFSKQTTIAALYLAKMDAISAGARDIRLQGVPCSNIRTGNKPQHATRRVTAIWKKLGKERNGNREIHTISKD